MKDLSTWTSRIAASLLKAPGKTGGRVRGADTSKGRCTQDRDRPDVATRGVCPSGVACCLHPSYSTGWPEKVAPRCPAVAAGRQAQTWRSGRVAGMDATCHARWANSPSCDVGSIVVLPHRPFEVPAPRTWPPVLPGVFSKLVAIRLVQVLRSFIHHDRPADAANVFIGCWRTSACCVPLR